MLVYQRVTDVDREWYGFKVSRMAWHQWGQAHFLQVDAEMDTKNGRGFYGFIILDFYPLIWQPQVLLESNFFWMDYKNP